MVKRDSRTGPQVRLPTGIEAHTGDANGVIWAGQRAGANGGSGSRGTHEEVSAVHGNLRAGGQASTACPTDQNRTFNATWPMRGSAEPLMLPNPPELTVVVGLLKFARLHRLKNSPRN